MFPANVCSVLVLNRETELAHLIAFWVEKVREWQYIIIVQMAVQYNSTFCYLAINFQTLLQNLGYYTVIFFFK